MFFGAIHFRQTNYSFNCVGPNSEKVLTWTQRILRENHLGIILGGNVFVIQVTQNAIDDTVSNLLRFLG
jgi:hypothetical protein